MQAMSLPRRYRAIFLAGATFTLLTDDAQARAALTAIHDHLLDGGRALIPLAGPNLAQSWGVWREARDDQGVLLRVATMSSELDQDRRLASTCLRYERVHQDGSAERLDRTIHTRWWRAADFARMATEAGFHRTQLRTYDGGAAREECTEFVATLERGERV
jgi:hypothetical protein